MTDYGSTTEEIRARAIRSATYPQFESPTFRENWDRWLAQYTAAKRAEWEAEQHGRRQFTAAYTTQSGVVCPFGFPTVVQADAQAVADEFSREDPDGPNYFVATRILPPWLPVTNTESEDK